MQALKKEVAEKYQVLNGHGVGEYRYKLHVVHLELLSLEEADNLVADGFPYLVPVAPKPVPKRIDAA